MYKPCLERLGIANYFDIIIDVNKVGEGKSSPKIYEQIREQLKIENKNILVFEDTMMGLKTSYSHGFVSIAVYDKNSIKQDEEKKKYSYLYINSFDEILN